MNDIEKQEKMKEYYDKGFYYDAETQKEMFNHTSYFQKYRISKVLEIYTPKPHEKVVDLGCGWGTFEKVLAPMVKEIIGIDYSKKSIEICTNYFKTTKYTNVKFLYRNAYDTGLDAESYDLVICADLVEHLYMEVFKKTIQECNRILKLNGHIVIWTDCKTSYLTFLREHNLLLPKDITHIDYKTIQGMTKTLTDNGFCIIKAYYVESHIPFVRHIEKLLLKYVPFMRRRIAMLAKKTKTIPL